MTKAAEELAATLGKQQSELVLNGVTLTLRPLTLNDLVDYEREVGELSMTVHTATGVRYALWLSARRGGYEGTVEDIGEVITAANMQKVLAAVLGLIGPGSDDGDASGGERATPPADGPD